MLPTLCDSNILYSKQVARLAYTGRLKLTPISEKDFDEYCKLFSKKENMKSFGDGSVLSQEKVHAFMTRQLLRWEKNNYFGLFTVRNKDTNEFLGYVTLETTLCSRKDHVEISYIIDSEHWNKGYATEAIQGTFEYLEKLIRLPGKVNPLVVAATVKKDNGASKHILENLGMKKFDECVRFGQERECYKKILVSDNYIDNSALEKLTATDIFIDARKLQKNDVVLRSKL